MTRRTLLIFTSLFGFPLGVNARVSLVSSKNKKTTEKTIQAVQEHLFPKGSSIPSAKEMHANTFLFETIGHKSYDKDIRVFVIEGAEELERREKGRFVTLSTKEKEKALREYEKTDYGSSWLSRIMTLTMEGMFCDPIYGSNVKEAGWEALQSFGGLPRPTKKYLEI